MNVNGHIICVNFHILVIFKSLFKVKNGHILVIIFAIEVIHIQRVDALRMRFMEVFYFCTIFFLGGGAKILNEEDPNFGKLFNLRAT